MAEMEDTNSIRLPPFEFKILPMNGLTPPLIMATSTTAYRRNRKQSRKLCWSLTSN